MGAGASTMPSGDTTDDMAKIIASKLSEEPKEKLMEFIASLPADAKTKLSAAMEPEEKKPCFYTVVHTFNEGKAGAWWEAIKTIDMAALAKKNKELGFHNHYFQPSGADGPIHCLWECKADTSPEDFQKFIDGPDGPGEGVFVNKCYKVMPGAVLPPMINFDGPLAAAPVPSSGAMFWVYHEFLPDAAEGFWTYLKGMTPEQQAAGVAKQTSLGFFNHAFMPCTPEGPCICTWESKADVSIEEFQKFIDGPDGPGAGKVFKNTVYKSVPGGLYPSAHFPAEPTLDALSAEQKAKHDMLTGLGLPSAQALKSVTAVPAPAGLPATAYCMMKLKDGADMDALGAALKEYGAASKAAAGKVSACYSIGSGEVQFFETYDSPAAMDAHIGDCFPAYVKILAHADMTEIILTCDPAQLEFWKTSTAAWQASKLNVQAAL